VNKQGSGSRRQVGMKERPGGADSGRAVYGVKPAGYGPWHSGHRPITVAGLVLTVRAG